MTQETFYVKKSAQIASKIAGVVFMLMGVGMTISMFFGNVEGVFIGVLFGLFATGFGFWIFQSSSQGKNFVILSDEGINVNNKFVLNFTEIIEADEIDVTTTSRGFKTTTKTIKIKYLDKKTNTEKESNIFNEKIDGYAYIREKLFKNIGR